LSMLALAAVPGSLLIARFGVVLVATCGLAIASLASAARAAAFDLWTLYAATLIMGFGIAIFQPALPTVVRAWAPTRVWLANAVAMNGMLMGVTITMALSIPVVLPLVGGSWRLNLLVWSLPGLIAALLFIAAAPPARGTVGPEAAATRWMPDWRSRQLWLLGIALGSNNALWFASNGFVPDYLTSTGRSDLIGPTLTWLNGTQVIGSFVMLFMPERLQRQNWPFTVFGPVTLAGLLGIVITDGIWIVVSAAAAGLGAAVTFIVTFGLPAILSPPGEVHRVAGGMFTISYSIAVIVPIICGAVWDLTGLPWTAFMPLALCAVLMTIFGTVLSRQSARD
jgi:MFS transporter, CP family, cyanate transporter